MDENEFAKDPGLFREPISDARTRSPGPCGEVGGTLPRRDRRTGLVREPHIQDDYELTDTTRSIDEDLRDLAV